MLKKQCRILSSFSIVRKASVNRITQKVMESPLFMYWMKYKNTDNILKTRRLMILLFIYGETWEIWLQSHYCCFTIRKKKGFFVDISVVNMQVKFCLGWQGKWSSPSKTLSYRPRINLYQLDVQPYTLYSLQAKETSKLKKMWEDLGRAIPDMKKHTRQLLDLEKCSDHHFRLSSPLLSYQNDTVTT